MKVVEPGEVTRAIHKWRPYPAYKHSGVEWLGKIPEHWHVKRLKFAAKVNMGQSPNSEEYNIAGDGLPFLQGNAEFGVDHPEAKLYCPTARKRALRGDILLSVRAPVGALNVADQEYGIGRGLCAISPDDDGLANRFTRYLLEVVRLELDIVATGSTYEAVSVDEVGSLRCVLPPLREQRAIAHFLDRETAKIDVLVKKKERLIELLQEKRAAIISQAVTKGLDPNVPMKDSGVEWLGKIPPHWEIKRGRHLGYLLGSPNLDAFELDDEGSIRYMKVDDLNRSGDGFYLEDSAERMRPLARSPRLLEGEIILFPKRGAAIFTNKVRIVKEPVLFDSNLMGWRLFPTVCNKYIAFTLLARGLTDLADVSSVPQINNKHIYPSFFPFPPREEQDAIGAFLDVKMVKMDSAIAKVREGIEKLKEYRTALISAAVTGKIDVRGDYRTVNPAAKLDSRSAAPSPQFLILIGPNGTGKTTVGQLLVKHFDCRFVSIESFFQQEFGEQFRGNEERAYPRLERLLRETVATENMPVVFEEVGINPHAQSMIARLQENFRVVFVELVASEDECLKRVANRPQENNFPKDPQRMRRVRQLYFETGRAHYPFLSSFDTEALSEDEIIEKFRPILSSRGSAGRVPRDDS